MTDTDDLAAVRAEGRALLTSFHERTARRHDDGEHKGESPTLGCAQCEMEHPKGRFAVLTAERDALRAQVEEWREAWTEIAVDHTPALLNERQHRNWCSCGNWHLRGEDWRAQTCTAALAASVLARYPEEGNE